jgi:hypothetical protein
MRLLHADTCRKPYAGNSAEAATGISIRPCPQCHLELTLTRIARRNGRFSKFISAGLDPLLTVSTVCYLVIQSNH